MSDAVMFVTGGVNSYLLPVGDAFVMIDGAFDRPARRASLTRRLADAGCSRGKLSLVIVTHADADHAGNCRYFQEEYGARIALHSLESEAARSGDMLLSRKDRSSKTKITYGMIKYQGFTPDLLLEDGQSLAEFGLDATVLHLPGHTSGSIGVLMRDGDLYCGDLFTNAGKPEVNMYLDDPAAAAASFERLKKYGIRTVCPGHGNPFPFSKLQ